MKITDLKIRRISCHYTGTPIDCADTSIVNATDIYADFKRHASAARVTITPTETADGKMKLSQDFLQIDTEGFPDWSARSRFPESPTIC